MAHKHPQFQASREKVPRGATALADAVRAFAELSNGAVDEVESETKDSDVGHDEPVVAGPDGHESVIDDPTLTLNSTPSLAVDQLIEFAAAAGASDLFLSMDENDWSVTMRLHGVIRDVCRLDAEMGQHCAAHIRVEAEMDIAEHRKPQDGRWMYRLATGKPLDLRINSLPTLHGEDMAIRLLDRAACLLGLDHLGLSPADRERLENMLASPGGLILVSGPTGSGKSTTLYACIEHLNSGERRIHTIEDPIEYVLPGIHQSQIHEKQGLHFADLLRGIIRQGPDVIMIGEIRDAETAQTAVRAANSGHLVLATIHAPMAAGCVASLLAFDVASHFLATCLLGAVSQRLVRTFCPHCRFPLDDDLSSNASQDPPVTCYAALGCQRCHQTGFGGRTAVFELLEVTPPVRELIQNRNFAQVIEEQAYRDGMNGMLRSAEHLIRSGLTNRSEVERCIPTALLKGFDLRGERAKECASPG